LENRLYPTWQQLEEQNNPLTEGEKALLKYLDLYLPRDPQWKNGDKLENYNGWLIFAQPFLNGLRPDIIIFNPQIGLFIYEVKDWNLDNYKYKEGELLFNGGQPSHPVRKVRKKSPISQVEHYKKKLIEQLVPSIGEAIDQNQRSFGIIKTGVYFHKEKTEICRKFLEKDESFKPPLFGKDESLKPPPFGKDESLKPPPFGKDESLKHTLLFGYDCLAETRLKEIVPDVGIRSVYWNRKWNLDILFWLNPPFHSIEQGTILKLKGNQVKVAEPKSGHHRVRGVAGSGKTQALAYRAGKLASQGLNVLVITFNITLWHYIKDMVARSPFNFSWNKITFTHFHGFCKDRLNELGREWPESSQQNGVSNEEELNEKELNEKELEYFFKKTVPNAVERAISGAPYQKYDAILIDEGQDYHFEWYLLLHTYFLNDHGEVVIVCDKRQNIFDRELDWLDKRVTKEGLDKFKEPYIDLTVTFRLPKRIAVMSNEFSEDFDLNQELKVGQIENNPVLFHSQHIVWLNIDDDEWLPFVHNAFKRLKKEGYSPSDMVILLPSHKLGKIAVDFFKEKKIEVNHVFEEGPEAKHHVHKKAFWMGDGRLKMSTIHSFKGWELLNIVLFIPAKAPETNRKLDALVYTALTRAKENLIVLNANKRYHDYGDKFPKKWHEQ